jgi:hypothetical protein
MSRFALSHALFVANILMANKKLIDGNEFFAATRRV